MVSKIIFNKLNYQIMEKEPVRVLTLFLCNGKNTGNHIEKEGTIYFFKPYNHS